MLTQSRETVTLSNGDRPCRPQKLVKIQYLIKEIAKAHYKNNCSQLMTSTELYDQDFNLWLEQTIHHLQHQNFVSLDLEHLIEELQTLGKSEKKCLRSNLMILIAHLLKLTVQFDVPETMKMSWYRSVAEHRKRVLIDIKDTPSLKAFLPTALAQAYPDARDLAIRESKFAAFGITSPPEDHYPLACPFSLEQLLDEDFYG